MSHADMTAKHDSQIGAILSTLTKQSSKLDSIHRILVTNSVLGPATRAPMVVSSMSFVVAIVALVVALGACQ